MLQPVSTVRGMALAYTRTPSPRARVTMNRTDAARLVVGPNRRSSRT